MCSTSRRKFLQNISITAIGAPLLPAEFAGSGAGKNDSGKKAIMKESNSSDTTSDILVNKLIAWKVEVIFGIIGDGVNPMIEAQFYESYFKATTEYVISKQIKSINPLTTFSELCRECP